MAITNVNGPDEFRKKLEKALTKFMEEGEPFNVQGGWTGDDGVTVSVLVDFGIQDPCDGGAHLGTVSARFEDNLKVLERKTSMSERKPISQLPRRELIDALGESDTFLDAENALTGAVENVFDLGFQGVRGEPQVSDIDVFSTVPIDYSRWPTHDDVDRIECGNNGLDFGFGGM